MERPKNKRGTGRYMILMTFLSLIVSYLIGFAFNSYHAYYTTLFALAIMMLAAIRYNQNYRGEDES